MYQKSTPRRWLAAFLAASLTVGCTANDTVSGTGTRTAGRSSGARTTPAPAAPAAVALPVALQPRAFQPSAPAVAGVRDVERLRQALVNGAYYSFIETSQYGLQFVGQVTTVQPVGATLIKVDYKDGSGRVATANGSVKERAGIYYLEVELKAASGEVAVYRMARFGDVLRGTLETRTADGTKVVLGAVWRATPPAAVEARFAPKPGTAGNGSGSAAFGFGAGSIVQSGSAGLPSVVLLPGVNAGVQVDATTPQSGVAGFVPSGTDGGAVADAPGDSGGAVLAAGSAPVPPIPGALPPNLADEVIAKEEALALTEQNPSLIKEAFGSAAEVKYYVYAETAGSGLQYFASVDTRLAGDVVNATYRDPSGRQATGLGEIKTKDGFEYIEIRFDTSSTDEGAVFRLAKFGNEFRGTMQTKDKQGRDVVIGVVWKIEAPSAAQQVLVPQSGSGGNPAAGAPDDSNTDQDAGTYGFGAGAILDNQQADIPSTTLIPGVNAGVQVDGTTSGGGTAGFIPTDTSGGLQSDATGTGGAYDPRPNDTPLPGDSLSVGIGGSESSTILPGTSAPAPILTPVPGLTPLPLATLPPTVLASEPQVLTPEQIQQQVAPTTEQVLQGVGTVGSPGHYYVYVETQANGLQFVGEMDTAFESDRVALGWMDASGRKASGSGRIVSGVVPYLEAVMGSSLGDGAIFRVARFGDEYRGTMETTNAKGERVLVGVVWRTQAPEAGQVTYAPDPGTSGNVEGSGSYGFGTGEVLDANAADLPSTVLIPGVNGGLAPDSTEVTTGTGGTDGYAVPAPAPGATPLPTYPPYTPTDAPAGTIAAEDGLALPPLSPALQVSEPQVLTPSEVQQQIDPTPQDVQQGLGTVAVPGLYYVYVETQSNGLQYIGRMDTAIEGDRVALGWMDASGRKAAGSGTIVQGVVAYLEGVLGSSLGDGAIFRVARFGEEYRGTMETTNAKGERVLVGVVWRTQAPSAAEELYNPDPGTSGNVEGSGSYGFGSGEILDSQQADVPSTLIVPGVNGGLTTSDPEVVSSTGGTDGVTAPAPVVGATPLPEPTYVPEDAPPGTPASENPPVSSTPMPIQTAPPQLQSALIPPNSQGLVTDVQTVEAALGTPQNPAAYHVYIESLTPVYTGQIRVSFSNSRASLGYLDTAERRASGTGRLRVNRNGLPVLRSRMISDYGDRVIFRMVRYLNEFRGTMTVTDRNGVSVVLGCIWTVNPPVPLNRVHQPVLGRDGNRDPAVWGFGAGTVILNRLAAVPSVALIEDANAGILIDSTTPTSSTGGFIPTETAGGVTSDAPGDGGVYDPSGTVPTPTPDPYYATQPSDPEPVYTPLPGLVPTPSPAPSVAPTAGPTPSPAPSVAPTAGPTPSPAPSVAPTAGPTPSPAPSVAPTAGPTPSPAPSGAPTAGPTPSPAPSGAPTAGPTPSPAPSGAPTAGPTPSPAPTASNAVPPGEGGPTPT
ncbi:MAG: hypothetical protein VKO21_03325, partial [Candidatus Sericytochromatia bacterium]|nr:hypothetical protein [Candidatus Sericytochromatia bacterium]